MPELPAQAGGPDDEERVWLGVVVGVDVGVHGEVEGCVPLADQARKHSYVAGRPVAR